MWNVVVTNPAYDAISGASAWRGIERNAVWRNVVGPGPIATLSSEEREQQTEGIVADLRLTAARYPADPRVQRLVAELRRRSPRFVELWKSSESRQGENRSQHKFVDHPEAGRIGLDCDTLIVAGDDLRIMIYSAEPGSEDAERLALAIVLGTQALALADER